MTDLCAMADGLAPAVEMGASRLRALSQRDRIDRFDDRFDTAKARARCTIERHQC
jgi:predicted ATPase